MFLHYAQGIHPFEAEEDDEISFGPDDLIAVLQQKSSDAQESDLFWRGTKMTWDNEMGWIHGPVGLFQSNFVTVVKDAEVQGMLSSLSSVPEPITPSLFS